MNLNPSAIRLPDVTRRLPQHLIADIARDRPPADGDLVLAEVVRHSAPAQIDLVSGRCATLYGGDLLWVAVGRYEAPLAVGCERPLRWGEAALIGRSGIAGIPTLRAAGAREPAELRLLGLAQDAQGLPVTLSRLGLPQVNHPRPLNTIAVVSCARGSLSGAVAAAVVRGFHRTGLRVATAKPIGVIDAAERWRFIDAGASLAVDLADVGHLSAAGMGGGPLCELSRRMLGRLGSAGVEAAVLRVAGGLAVPEVAALIETSGFAGLIDGVVLTAADALSALEGARRLHALGLPLIAVSGAITNSPLASREAGACLRCPVLKPQELTRPATLQRLLSLTLQRSLATAPILRLAA